MQDAATRLARTHRLKPRQITHQHSVPPWSAPPSALRRWSSSAQRAWGRPWRRRRCARLPRCQSRRPTPYSPCRSTPYARPPGRVAWVAWVPRTGPCSRRGCPEQLHRSSHAWLEQRRPTKVPGQCAVGARVPERAPSGSRARLPACCPPRAVHGEAHACESQSS